MESLPTTLSLAQLNAKALKMLVWQPVSTDMIRFLARAASNVIQCDPGPIAPAAGEAYTSDYTSSPRTLPTLEKFIDQVVRCSNVQVPTLMSSLVYLNRLKSRLGPRSKGLPCSAHRIFLACLILSAKYLNDSSPKNKHWANYSVMYGFGFNRTEVNLMEKQLLFLLDWDLRITKEDLYRELDHFLAPIREEIEERYWAEREMQARQEREWQAQQEREKQLRTPARIARPHQREVAEDPIAWQAAYNALPADNGYDASPPRSRGSSRSRGVSPPGLCSSASSYAGSTSSRATTPLGDEEEDIGTVGHQPYIVDGQRHAGEMCYSPIEVVPDVPAKDPIYAHGRKASAHAKKPQMLPYEISKEDLRSLEGKQKRGVWGRVLSGVGR